MNVYQKLALARQKLKEAGLKQSGRNRGLGYTYFDLSDILPMTTQLEKELGLLSVVTFTETQGSLTIYNTEQTGESITFTSPMREAELRGCHPVQNLGAMETYVRRYLYLLAYEIVETEALDIEQGTDKPVQPKASREEKKPELSKAQKISALIKDTDIQAQEITGWIENNLGVPKRVNELTDEEFKKLYTALERAVKNLNG